MRLGTLRLKTRLIIGFGLILTFTLIFGIIATILFNKLEKNTIKLYNHPLAVSNAVRDIRIYMNCMHNSVINLLQAEHKSEIKEMEKNIDSLSREIMGLFSLVKERFLGNKQDVNDSYQIYLDWKATCNKILRDVKNKEKENALITYKQKGKEEFMLFNKKVQVMIDFANKKAACLIKYTSKTEKFAHRVLILFIISTFFLGVFITILIIKSINQPLNKILTKIKDISKEHYNYQLNVTGKNELEILEESINQLQKIGSVLHEEINERKKSENIIKDQYEEIQSYSEQLRSAKEDLEIKIKERTHELETSKERFKTLLKLLPVGIIITDTNGKCEYVNEKWTEMTGLSIEKAQGDKWANALYPDDKKIFVEWEKMIASHEDWNREYRFRKKDGTITWVLTTAIKYSADGKTTGYIVANMDITHLKEVEKALIDERNFTNSLMESSPVGIIVFDTKGIVTYSNSAAENIISLKKEELLNQNLISQQWKITNLQGKQIPTENLPFQKVLKTKEPILNYEFILFVNETQPVFIKLNAVPLFDKEKNIYRIITVINDITKRKKVENDLITAKEKAEESDRLKSAFLANMSHEVRTPMNGIMGFASLLKDPNKSPEMQQKYIDIIWASTNQLLHIINDILDISKLAVGQIETFKSEISINFLLDELYKFFNAEIIFAKKTIELRLNKGVQNGEDCIYTDEQRLKQILTNLLSNAVKFTNRGYIEFGYTKSQNNTVEFYVKDTGIGIPKEKQEAIFGRFRQADESTTRKYGGIGLGLPIVKGCVKILNGHLKLESNEGEGSSFYFTIPGKLFSKENATTFIDQDEELNFKWGEKSILIVEDDLPSYEYLKEVLSDYKINVMHTESGFNAIQLCKTNKNINLVLMDIRLPDIDGFEATKLIKAIRIDLPVIAQTANVMPKDKEKSKEAGCDAFLEKPLVKEKILRLINKYFTT